MKKLFFAALIALAGFTACGTKNVETAATEATEQREVGDRKSTRLNSSHNA